MIPERDVLSVAACTPSAQPKVAGASRRLVGRMRLLVLGGTAWLGREVAAAAVSRGHEVTCLARGSSGEVLAEVRFVRADRDRADAYDLVAGERWEAVVDVARQPGHLRRAVAALEPAARRFLFVSSGNVYASQRELDEDEDAPLLPPLQSDVMESMERYGEAKVACEQAVTGAFGAARALIARVGLIGGPGDESGRSGYWPWRFARPSNRQEAVIVPDAPDVPTAVIDAATSPPGSSAAPRPERRLQRRRHPAAAGRPPRRGARRRRAHRAVGQRARRLAAGARCAELERTEITAAVARRP